VREGTNVLPLTKGQLDLPPGLDISEIRPALVVLELGKKVKEFVAQSKP
jgi:hypothetical protein